MIFQKTNINMQNKLCKYFVCIQSQSYNCGDPDKCREKDCCNCPCDYPLKYGCLICGNYDEYDMICLKKIKSEFQGRRWRKYNDYNES